MNERETRCDLSMEISEKKLKFDQLGTQIDAYSTKGLTEPDSLFQQHRILDYWLSVNYPGWQSRYGYPSSKPKFASENL